MQDSNDSGQVNVPQMSENPQVMQPQLQKRFCKHCGAEIQVGVAFCPACGGAQSSLPQQAAPQQMAPAYQQPGQPVQQAPAAGAYQQPQAFSSTANTNSTTTVVNVQGGKSNGLGTAGFVLSLLAFLVGWIPGVDLVVWFLGALFSFIGVFKQPRGLAIAGLVISFIGIIVLVTFFGALIGLASMH